jgi:hypothetical protein
LINCMFNHGKQLFGPIILIFAFHWYDWFLFRLWYVLLVTELCLQLLNFSAKMLYHNLAQYWKMNSPLRTDSFLQTLLCLCCLNPLNIYYVSLFYLQIMHDWHVKHCYSLWAIWVNMSIIDTWWIKHVTRIRRIGKWI